MTLDTTRFHEYNVNVNEYEAPILKDFVDFLFKHSLSTYDMMKLRTKLDYIRDKKPITDYITAQDVAAPLLTTSSTADES